MAFKRSSRIFANQGAAGDPGHQSQMASAYLSQRSSRNSLQDGSIEAAHDKEESQRNDAITRESQATTSRSHSLAASDKDTLMNTSSRCAENTATSMSPSTSVSDSLDCLVPGSNGRPINFGVVFPGVYRSSYPKPQDYHFLGDLGLKTILTLVKKDQVDHDLKSFLTTNGIRQIVFNMKGTKKEAIPMSTMRAILEVVLDSKNYPLMIHCNHGKHRTGCVVAAIRKLSGWQLNAVVDEYKAYAEPKVRECDVDYINAFPCLQHLYHVYGEPARFSPVQVRSFFRGLLFTSFAMVVWLVSGSRIHLGTRDSVM
ncbi:tyrosine phosphatase [Metarhizium album ARSEF 1941]|uniref:diphosphoinositol-polyphosphate diphosphatase n=1 Tax=Metarhizium album (strain ARSEF 1941) TaxID=1081103 RepID=A0A0B2WMV3_METAS|nr:tyrosine phosphatase [Metarhizium album ARSEF 1941]KHN94812.1 tyrosine phosphatase [Metarhizium album ARSEF 1941]